MKIYTKTGDQGETGLIGGKRVKKNDPRVGAYGEIDETNCAIGLAVAALGTGGLRDKLLRIQDELFVVGSILAGQDERFPPTAAVRLESEIDEMTADLAPLKRFILPGGCPAGAALHLARAVCRRAERAAISLEKQPAGLVVYLNRLSDHLFTAARFANHAAGAAETVWEGLGQR